MDEDWELEKRLAAAVEQAEARVADVEAQARELRHKLKEAHAALEAEVRKALEMVDANPNVSDERRRELGLPPRGTPLEGGPESAR
jgi:multidrug resistance efflux pump